MAPTKRKWSDQAGPSMVDIDGNITAETDKAWMLYDGKRHVWLPKSVCQWDEQTGKMTVPEWLARDKGLV